MARPLLSIASRRWSPWVRHVTAGAAGALCIFDTRNRSTHCDGGMIPPPPTGDTLGAIVKEKVAQSQDERKTKFLLAIPKKGRLYEVVSNMLKGAGIEFSRADRLDICHSSNLPVSIVFLPAHDIAAYVADGDVDLGITGEDCIAETEHGHTCDVIMKLGMGKCNLSVQAPEALGDVDAKFFAGKRIVTSFPYIAKKFFEEFEEPGKPTDIKCISGSVEAAVGLGLADAIVDLVETGRTMRAAGLKEVAVVMKSQTVMIANPNSKHPELIETIRRRIAGYITAQRWVMLTYNVHESALSRACQITPGKRSPTVTNLQEKGCMAVQVLVPKGAAACIMDELQLVGARDILLTSLLSTRFDEGDLHDGSPSTMRGPLKSLR